jgi:uncharacterized membrane protein
MNITEAASLTGIVLCAIFLLWVLIGRITAQIRLRREIEKDEAYRESWSEWGDVTDLREA